MVHVNTPRWFKRCTLRTCVAVQDNGFWNKGISACAVCDGAAPIFRNKVSSLAGCNGWAGQPATGRTTTMRRHLLGMHPKYLTS